MPIAFSTWMVLLNNFSVERASFTGVEIGILQSIREIPGFLAFTIIFLLFYFKEQYFAIFSLALTGFGVAITGFLPTVYGLYFTTIIMSTGFHYCETAKNSLSLQWLSKEEAPPVLGKLIAVSSITSLFFNFFSLLKRYKRIKSSNNKTSLKFNKRPFYCGLCSNRHKCWSMYITSMSFYNTVSCKFILF